jgi:uncharacterized protein YbcV (DUF1398 family)
MFTIEQIEFAHSKVKSGVDFPTYIKEIKAMGVKEFETWVKDSHTTYFGLNYFSVKSKPKYEELEIASKCDRDKFIHYLKIHQQGETDYFTFCKHAAETGVEKWVVNLDVMTCVYFDRSENKILLEAVPIL